MINTSDSSEFKDEEHVVIYLSQKDLRYDESVSIPETLIGRVTGIGKAYGMHYLGMFDIERGFSLNGTQCTSLREELRELGNVTSDSLVIETIGSFLNLLKRNERNPDMGIESDGL